MFERYIMNCFNIRAKIIFLGKKDYGCGGQNSSLDLKGIGLQVGPSPNIFCEMLPTPLIEHFAGKVKYTIKTYLLRISFGVFHASHTLC
jgi:hypothetical protein